MVKSFWLTASLSVALTASIAEAAFSVPIPQENQSSGVVESKVAKSEANVPLCYMKTADGRILDLSSFCDKQAGDSGLQAARPAPTPYNNSAIKKFDNELYGEEN